MIYGEDAGDCNPAGLIFISSMRYPSIAIEAVILLKNTKRKVFQ